MKNVKEKRRSTIFRIFLFPLIAIMLVQSVITIGTLVARKTTETLEEYSSSMMSRLVENRRVILQNDMNQRWATVREQEALLNNILEDFLAEQNTDLEELLQSEEQKEMLLELVFPECKEFLQNSSTTGLFLILTGQDMAGPEEFDGFYVRDSDPDKRPVNDTDLLLERGSKQLSRAWDIPLDTGWTTRFHMDGLGQTPADNYFYEPWRAGAKHQDAETEDLGYWSMPFSLGKNQMDSYEMITYSLPLRYQGQVYGVLGVEISNRRLNSYFPVLELNDSQQTGYMLAVKGREGDYMSLTGKGLLYDLIRSVDDRFILRETKYANLSLVEGTRLNGQGIYAVVCPLRLYSNNVPYENTEWVLLGLDTENDLFGMSRQLYFWMVVAVLVGLAFGVFGIYIVVRHLTRPIQQLMQCISKGSQGLKEFKTTNILEVDALYHVVADLTKQQKEAENILLEEKERYKMALESSEDIFFSYDLQKETLDLVNHKTMSGQWHLPKTGESFINTDYIFEEDREKTLEAIKQDTDNPYAEFRMRWPGEKKFTWVALTGKAVYDTDDRRWKLVGSIRNIQEQKEREEKLLQKNTIDEVTGLYVFHAGIEQIREYRSSRPDGVMINLFLDGLKQANEKNGIMFGDMILEEAGSMLREACREHEGRTQCAAAALRLNLDEFVVWLENQTREDAQAFFQELLRKISVSVDEETFRVRICGGLSCGKEEVSGQELICRARLARSICGSGNGQCCFFYEDLTQEQRKTLPPLQGQEINSLDYTEDMSLVSVALNLFGKGEDFPAQMRLMIRKIGRFYKASDVLVSLLRADFNSNYLYDQWHENRECEKETVRKYGEEERADFCSWLGQAEVRYFSEEESLQPVLQCFLSMDSGQQGILLPMYDNGTYMGNLCILGLGPELLDNPEEYQNLAELGRVIQGQLNQQQHDIASKAKSEFLSRMSHEIRTPMNGIIGMTAIALQQGQTPERMVDCLQKIQSSSDYLLGLINDILDMSKIESGKMKLEPVNFNIYEMIDTIRELILSQAAAKNVEFAQDISLDHSWFVADRMRISQVLINLLGNAVKFTPEGGKITLTIQEVTSLEKKAYVHFAVSDTGIGIAKEDQERVFRSFEQAAGTNPSKQAGTGLGLSISSRLVQLMGSSIQLDSTPGKGSKFSFSVSLMLGDSQEEKSEKEELSFEGFRVLVVEDNELNAEIAQCLLEERNFEVDCVYDGKQAVERIQSTQPGTYDVILMDIMMPVMNGLDAARRIRGMEREDCQTIPIIAMSANAFDDDLKKSVECGMNGHLSKPVEVDKLYQTLDSVIRKKRK